MNILQKIMAVAAALISMAGILEVSAQSRQSSSASVSSVIRLANAGDADALNQLGVWYYSGQNVTRDFDKAVDLWQQSARQGNPKAIANLGICYQYGSGVPRDSLTAMRLYVAAIDAGQENLLNQRKENVGKSAFDGMLVGLCYEKGIGVERNAAEAARAYSASADLGSADAAAAAARCLRISGDNVSAYRYAIKAAESGNAEAQALAGIMLVDGTGVTPYTKKGVELLLMAAPSNTDAVNRLASLMFAAAPEVSPYTQRITSMLADAARQGNRQAMLNYARAYRDGIGVNRDFDRAIHWLTLIRETGDESDAWQFTVMSPDNFRNYVRARELTAEGKFAEADKLLKNLQRKNITEASVMRAAILANPQNPDSDSGSAIKQLRKLSGKSDRAATLLATIYREGTPGGHDYATMLSLLSQAAGNGYGPAAAVLADIYSSGEGVSPDSVRAASYARQARLERDIAIPLNQF